MDKLSALRVPPEWESALIACIDEPPVRTRDHRRAWLLGSLLVLAGIAGVAVWFVR